MAAAVAAGLVAVACGVASDAESSTTADLPPLPESSTLEEAPPPPNLDPDRIERGEALYGLHCAVCHGPHLEGTPNWQIPNPDGTYPPPPHDASGHTWHHADGMLVEIIRDGSDFDLSRMPVFGGILTDDEILAVLEFFKSHWGPVERSVNWQQTWAETQ